MGALRKDHNSSLSYLTLFEFNKQSIINYKMMKIQFRLFLILLNNLLLRDTDITLTNYDRAFENIGFNQDPDDPFILNSTQKWINACLSNRSRYCYSKAFILQQSFSALLDSFVIANIGNIKFPNLSHYLIKRRALLLSSVNTNADIYDEQYYVTLNTLSPTIAFFLYNFFRKIIEKTNSLNINYSHNTLLNFRYWFGLRHIFSLRYVRRAFFLRGLLARGIFFFCLHRLLKSYRRIALYNFYCTEFMDNTGYSLLNEVMTSSFLKKMRDTRFLKPRLLRRRYLRKYRIRYLSRFYNLNVTRIYFFNLFRRRLRIKRFFKNISIAFC